MRRSILLLSLCLAISALTGCGQKGPLFLPATRPTPASSAPGELAPVPAGSSAMPASAQS
jgi:predicted small lipoprotein YifL